MGQHSDDGLESDLIADVITADLLDAVPFGIAVFETGGVLRGCNAQWMTFAVRDVHLAREQVVPGLVMFEQFAPGAEWLDAIARCYATRQAVVTHGVPLHAGGTTAYFDIVWSPLLTGGEPTGIIQVMSDATERVRSYQILEQRVEERTAELDRRRVVAEGLHDVLAILNSCCPTDEVLDYIISQAKLLLGADAVGVYRMEQTGHAVLTLDAHGISDDLLADIAYPTNEGFVAATIMQREPLIVPDSKVFWGPITERMGREAADRIYRVFTRYKALLATPIVLGDQIWGALAMYYAEPREFPDEQVGLASDLADHLALAVENAQLRQSAETAAALDERARLARDLHDAVTQTLFSASLIAEVLPRLWERDRAEGLKRLLELQHLTRGALAEMRTLLLELRPAALEEADLGEVLRQLAESKATSGLDVEVVIEGEPRRLPPDVHLTLYRTAQEALNNVTKHSGAARAEVALRYLPSAVELCVDDNGTGFDPGAVGGEHMGLRIMRERAGSVGATFGVESRPGIGTCVSVMVDDGEAGCGCRTA